jgi:hypothetical protein
MRYFGVQFKMARVAVRLGSREVCKALRMSPKTLVAIEGASEIEYGMKRKGCFEEQIVADLVTFYEKRGVRFHSRRANEPGISIQLAGPCKPAPKKSLRASP